MNQNKPENKMLFTSDEIKEYMEVDPKFKYREVKFKSFEGRYIEELLKEVRNFLKEKERIYVHHTHSKTINEQGLERHSIILSFR